MLKSVNEKVKERAWRRAYDQHLIQVDDPVWIQIRKQIKTPILMIIYGQVMVLVRESIK